MWKVPRIWDSGDVWIIGGGASVFNQFNIPKSVVDKVIRGDSTPKEYAPYMEAIHNKHVIGINVAYMLGDWVDMVFFGDKSFFLKNKEGLAMFQGLRVSCHQYVENYFWAKYLAKDTKKKEGISDNRSRVSWNSNSGAAAISIAANAGAKRIFLLGFDMKLDENNLHHFHGEYIVKDRELKRRNKLPFDRHLVGFKAIKQDAETRGIEIINVNPDSAIVEFKKMNLKEALCY